VLADAGLVHRDSVGTRHLYRPDIDGIATMRSFMAIDARNTRVELEHRGLDAYGADAPAMRDTFGSPNGWTGMLEQYALLAGQRAG